MYTCTLSFANSALPYLKYIHAVALTTMSIGESSKCTCHKAAPLLCLRHCHSCPTSSYHNRTTTSMMQMMSTRRMTITITATNQPGVPERRMHYSNYNYSHQAMLDHAHMCTHTNTCTHTHKHTHTHSHMLLHITLR